MVCSSAGGTGDAGGNGQQRQLHLAAVERAAGRRRSGDHRLLRRTTRPQHRSLAQAQPRTRPCESHTHTCSLSPAGLGFEEKHLGF